MALQTTLGARCTIIGDGQSKSIVLDLNRTIFQIGEQFRFLPVLPDSVVSVRIGGPGFSPERINQIVGKLHGDLLVLLFSCPLLLDKDSYTIEIVFGYDSVVLPTLENLLMDENNGEPSS